MSVLAGLCALTFVISIILVVRTFLDARNRGLQGGSRLLWVLVVLFLNIIGLVIYIIVRPAGVLGTCKKCKNKVLVTLPTCPHCGNPSGRQPAPRQAPQRPINVPPAVQQQPGPMPQTQQPAPMPAQQQAAPGPTPKEITTCPNCGQRVEKDWKTCPKCSRKIEAEPTVIDEVFLMYRDGRLIKHFTRRLKPDVDQDILSGMLTAVQDFIKDTFRGETGELDEMKFGRFQIVMSRGRFITIAAVMYGDEIEPFRPQIVKAVDDIEGDYEVMLRDWDGDVDKLKVLGKYVNDLIDGRYA